MIRHGSSPGMRPACRRPSSKSLQPPAKLSGSSGRMRYPVKRTLMRRRLFVFPVSARSNADALWRWGLVSGIGHIFSASLALRNDWLARGKTESSDFTRRQLWELSTNSYPTDCYDCEGKHRRDFRWFRRNGARRRQRTLRFHRQLWLSCHWRYWPDWSCKRNMVGTNPLWLCY